MVDDRTSSCRRMTFHRSFVSGLLLASVLQPSCAWSPKEPMTRRVAVEFAGLSSFATFTQPSFADDVETFPEVEVVPVGDAKKVGVKSYCRTPDH